MTERKIIKVLDTSNLPELEKQRLATELCSLFTREILPNELRKFADFAQDKVFCFDDIDLSEHVRDYLDFNPE